MSAHASSRRETANLKVVRVLRYHLMPAAPGDQQAPRPEEIFISYSRKDKEFVRRLHEALSRRDREAWVDWEDIRPTEEWMQAIYAAIEGADTFVFVLTPDSIASDVCGREIAHAGAHNKRMVPIVAQDVNADAVPEALAKLNWIFFRESDDFEKAADTLIGALDTDLNWVHAHTRLLTRAIEWNAKGKNNSFVLRGDDLRGAEQWLAEAGAEKERQPTPLQTEYIIASRKAAAGRQRITLAAVTCGAVVALILASVAWKQRTKAVAQERIAIENAGKAKRTSVQADFDVALLQQQNSKAVSVPALAHLARALRTSGDAKLPRQYLISLLRDSPWYLPQTEPLSREDGVLATNREPTYSFPANSYVSFSPDGRRIVTASSDNIAQVWDVAVDLDSPLPAWVPELAEALGGRRFNEEGLLVPPNKSIVELRKELLALKGDDFWSRLGRWFFMRGPERTISPDSKITVGELDGLRAAAESDAAKEPPQSEPDPKTKLENQEQ